MLLFLGEDREERRRDADEIVPREYGEELGGADQRNDQRSASRSLTSHIEYSSTAGETTTRHGRNQGRTVWRGRALGVRSRRPLRLRC